MTNRRNFIKKTVGAAVFLSLGGLLSSCKKEQKEGYKIGFLTPKTGNDAFGGLSCERGAKIAEDLFKQFGLEGSITIVDTESNPDIARLKAEKLIQSGVHCLVGAFNSVASAAIAEVANSAKIPFIIDLSVADKLTEQKHSFVFRNFPKASEIGKESVLSIKKLFEETHFKAKTATLLILNDAYGQTIQKSFYDNKQNLPFEIVETIQFDYKAKDLSTEISKVKALNSDVLLVVSRSNTTNIIMRELIAQKHSPKMILGPCNQGFFEKQFLDNFKEKSDHLYTINTWIDHTSPLSRAANDLFSKKFPNDLFELNAAFSLEALFIAAVAYQKAKSFDGIALRDALFSLNEQNHIMHSSPIQFDKNGQRKNLKLLTLMNKDRKTYIVSPDTLKEIPPVLPFPGF